VRGTTRDRGSLEKITAVGAEAVEADPDRLATLLPLIEGVSIICWLMRTAPDPALHGPRLRSLLERLVDAPVRGFVYETGGGDAIVREAGQTYRMPVELLEADPGDHAGWLSGATAAVRRLLG
jgi:hypothetical protein